MTGLLIIALTLAGGRTFAPPPSFTLGEIRPPAAITRPAEVPYIEESRPVGTAFRLSKFSHPAAIDAGFALEQLFSSKLDAALKERNALFRIMTIEFEGTNDQLLYDLVTSSLPPAEQLRLLKIRISKKTAR